VPRAALAVLIALLLAGGILAYRPHYVILEPGPAPNAETLVHINAPTHQRSGSIHLTTVGLFDDVRVVQMIPAWFNRTEAVVPRSSLFPGNVSPQQETRQNAAEMDDSQRQATIAALGELYGYQNLTSKGDLVAGTVAGTPASKVLRPDDVITKADGQALGTPEQLEAAVQAHNPGDPVHLTVQRGGQTLNLDVTAVQNPNPQQSPARIIGVQISPDYVLQPNFITFDAQGIGGPSAGLAWALSIVNLLGPKDLTRGRTIADTGTIDYKGNVGDIGGITQKVIGAQRAGATIFLVPKDQVKDAQAAGGGSRMKIVGVSTLREAVEALSAP
jgi:PDZ domain-containing protein